MSTHKGNKAGDDYVVKTWELPSAKEVNEYIASRFREDQNLQAATYNALLEPGRARYRISDFPWDKSAEESRHARPADGPRARLSSEQYYSIILK